MALYDQVMEAAAAIQARSGLKPAVGMILGSGLGDLAAEIRDATAIPYGEIPHFLRSTVVGHAGRLLLGTLEDVPVVVMQGRFHFYEGYPLQALTLPVRVMRALGALTSHHHGVRFRFDHARPGNDRQPPITKRGRANLKRFCL